MDGLSKTDEVLALLNKHERGDASRPVQSQAEEPLVFTDYLPTPAAAILHSLQRVSVQRQPEASPAAPPVRTAEEALKVVLGEQRQDSARVLRYAVGFVCVECTFDFEVIHQQQTSKFFSHIVCGAQQRIELPQSTMLACSTGR